jgi:hypothetical protein
VADERAKEERDNARALLARFLPRAMEDGVLDEVEKRQLMGILTSGVLGRDDVQAIFHDYLMSLHRDMAADGMLSPAEAERCRTIVAELRIPHGFLPPVLAAVIDRR